MHAVILLRIIIWVTLVVIPFGIEAQSTPTAKETLHKMEWLLGAWTRTNAKPGRTAWETWTRKSASEWIGRGVSMKGTDTSFVEVLKIIIEKDKVYYVADVPENKKLVYFEITSVTNDSFTCENSSHDFPKKLVYQVTGSTLSAHISGGDKVIDYVFERKQP